MKPNKGLSDVELKEDNIGGQLAGGRQINRWMTSLLKGRGVIREDY